MAKIRDISRTKKKKHPPGKPAKPGRTPIAKHGEGKRKKKARKRLLEDVGGNKSGIVGDSSKDRATKKKSAKKSKRKKTGKRAANDAGGRDEKGRIKPGTVLNPKGRPKGALSLTAILREKLQEVPEGEKRTRAEMLIDTLIDSAIERGDHKMLKECLDRIEGKVPDRLIAAVGSGELQGMSEELLLAAVGVIEGEKNPVEEQAPDSQQDFMGPVQPEETPSD